MNPPDWSARVAAIAECTGVLLLAIGVGLALQVLWLGPGRFTSGDLSGLIDELPALLLLQAGVFAATALLMMRLRPATDGNRRRFGAFPALLVGLVGAAVAFGASWAVAALQRLVGVPVHEQEWILQAIAEPGALKRVFPLFVVVAPLGEELFFRGYVFGFLERRAGAGWAYAASALLFAAIHFNLSGLLVYTAIGLVLAGIYHVSGSLVAPITAHMGFNALVVMTIIRTP
jgi:membrane protease YdiL (CAAX protease family)